jgi:hypothetical protein
MDLFTDAVPVERQHPLFRSFRSVSTIPELDVIRRWADGFVDRDGKFVYEFQTTFFSSFWELYVFACFKELGFKTDFAHPTPDFVLDGPGGPFCAEAVVAFHQDATAPAWASWDLEEARNLDIPELLRVATIRLSNAVVGKHKKFKDTYSASPHVAGKPFVICATPFHHPLAFVQNDQAMRRVLFGFDQHVVVYNDERTAYRILGESRLDRVGKDSGSVVPLGLFRSPAYKEISAVLFSTTAAISKVRALSEEPTATILFEYARYQAHDVKPLHRVEWKSTYQETLLDGLSVFVNPFAEHRLPLDAFRGREVAIQWYDPKSDTYGVDAPDGFLIQRTSQVFRPIPKEAVAEARAVPPESSYPRPQRQPWREGELVPVGEVAIFGENHIAHYRGYTIMIAHDSIDDDWMAQGLKGTYVTLAEYVAQNAKDELDWFIVHDSFPTKEEAFRAAKDLIDETMGSAPPSAK